MSSKNLEQNRQAILRPIPPLLLDWYDKNRRILPWRENPQPYYVWVSEIMLQQTRVEAVKPYFERFLNTFPTVKDLADSEEEPLLKSWEGLGYYNRVRNMKKAAELMVEQFDGEVPPTFEQILTLPGIGEYTAGAIASIAYGIPVPAVDGNVLRVFARILADYRDIGLAAVKKELGGEISKIIPNDRAGDFNQALMELGATVCLPNGAPKCEACPMAEICTANKESLQAELPVKAVKKKRKKEKRAVFLIVNNNKVALRKRDNVGLLKGMWEFPNLSVLSPEEALSEWGIISSAIQPVGNAKHIFTHVEWHMMGYLVEVKTNVLPDGWIWAGKTDLAETYALPTAFSYYLKQFMNYVNEDK